jgi:MFS family permease
LRGLLALNLAVAAAGAMVIVNTVVLVQAQFGLGQRETAWALAAFGAGSMLAALALPRVLDGIADRTVMLAGAALLVAGLLAGLTGPGFGVLLPLWLVIGLGYSAVQTPTGRLLRRSAHPEDRPAQFALSHACWLIAYPLAGWLGAKAGLGTSFSVLALLAGLAAILAARLWPAGDPETVAHVHRDLRLDDPHLAQAEAVPGGYRHVHPFVIDGAHARWRTA